MIASKPRTFRGPVAEWLVEHVDGLPWHEAPAPRRRHRHWTQTTGQDRFGLEVVERCPCGAMRQTNPVFGVVDWHLVETPRVAPRRSLSELLRPRTYHRPASRH